MDARTFAVERLGVGDWPATDDWRGNGARPRAVGRARRPDSRIVGRPGLAFDVTPDRSAAAIAAAGVARGRPRARRDRRPRRAAPAGSCAGRGAGAKHAPVGCRVRRRRSGGVAAAELEAARRVGDGRVGERARAGVRVLFRRVSNATFGISGRRSSRRRSGRGERPLGDAWAWSRKNSTSNISGRRRDRLEHRHRAAVSGSRTFPEAPPMLWRQARERPGGAGARPPDAPAARSGRTTSSPA
jgi:hypothetical protein